jgi:hypothetical protein
MKQEQQRAVCKVVEADPSIKAGHQQGTGYLVSELLVVTCQHVVKNTPVGGAVGLRFFEGPTVTGKLREAGYQEDVAIITLDAPLTGIWPLALGERYDGRDAWEGFGYPATAKGGSLLLTGHVDLPEHTVAGRPRMVLQCNEAGDSIVGWSGSPVLIDDLVVGHIASFHGKPDDPSRPVHGKVYAVPVALVRRGLRDGEVPRAPGPLDAYLRDLVEKTRHIELQGFRSQAGMGKAALSCEVERLWTPMVGTPIHVGEIPGERGESFDRSGPRLLSEILHEGRRLLIEGQPGFGKTTFMRLVAGTLARDGLGGAPEGGASLRGQHLSWPDNEPWDRAGPGVLAAGAGGEGVARGPDGRDEPALLDGEAGRAELPEDHDPAVLPRADPRLPRQLGGRGPRRHGGVPGGAGAGDPGAARDRGAGREPGDAHVPVRGALERAAAAPTGQGGGVQGGVPLAAGGAARTAGGVVPARAGRVWAASGGAGDDAARGG